MFKYTVINKVVGKKSLISERHGNSCSKELTGSGYYEGVLYVGKRLGLC